MLHPLGAQLTVLTAQAIQGRHSKLPICRLRGSQHACVVTLALYSLCYKEHAHSSSSTQDPSCLLAPYEHGAAVKGLLVAQKYHYVQSEGVRVPDSATTDLELLTELGRGWSPIEAMALFEVLYAHKSMI